MPEVQIFFRQVQCTVKAGSNTISTAMTERMFNFNYKRKFNNSLSVKNIVTLSSSARVRLFSLLIGPSMKCHCKGKPKVSNQNFIKLRLYEYRRMSLHLDIF